jgi:hypothetical protein
MLFGVTSKEFLHYGSRRNSLCMYVSSNNSSAQVRTAGQMSDAVVMGGKTETAPVDTPFVAALYVDLC